MQARAPKLDAPPAVADVEAPLSGRAYVQSAESALRLGFLRKVYGILSVQLLFTFSLVALFVLNPPMHSFVKATPAILYVALAMYVGSAVTLTLCGPSVRRTYPSNYLLLASFTVATSLLVAVAACAYSPVSVGLASFYTFAIFGGLTAYAHVTKADFTPYHGSLVASLWGIFLFGLTLALLPASSALHALLGLAGALLFSFFIIVHTQEILRRTGPDEYISAALDIYLDVMNLFLRLLELVGTRERS